MLNETLTACECRAPGWCPRHQCEKASIHFEMCRRYPACFELFEQGRGPGQSTGKGSHADRRQPCRRLGPELRREPCLTCPGHIELKIYACALHQECSPARNAPGVQLCQSCDDYEPSTHEP